MSALLPLRLPAGRFDGVLLVADVAGFTALSEAHARSGPAGTEALSATINAVFAPLVGLVHAHGGEVAHFIGDAVVAVFPGAAEADACAARMEVPAGLTLRRELTAGTFTHVVVGDPAVRLAHVLIRGEAHVPSVEGTAFVHPSVAARLDAGRAAMLAEHRTVTSLFVELPGVADAAIAVRTLDRFGGSLLQVECVEHGNRLKATFGAPQAYEDDERRAAACALALREELPDAAFGLSAGTVFCGLIGSAERCEYTVLGDAVNVAARLLRAARPGQILAAESVRRRVDGSWRALGPLALRGRDEPVVAYELTGPVAAPLAGRARELERLGLALEAARAGAGGVIVVSGEAGIGKSRLLGAVVERAVGFAVVRGEGQPYRRDHPYGAWADAARVLGVDLDDPRLAGLPPEVRAGAVHELVVEAVRARGPLLLVFEDGHWLDRPSRELLERVAAEVPSLPALLLVSERDGDFPGQRIDLGPLPPEAIARIVGDGRPDVVARAAGNPLYAEELVRLGGGELPASLRATVTARLDRLAEEQRAVLRVAAVVGTRFAPEWLSGSDPGLGDVAPALHALAALGVVHPDGAEYAFKHAVLREVAYETLAVAAREQLHAAVAGYVERAEPRDLESLAYHYGHSADTGKQRLYFRRAGDAARGAFANESAIRHYERLVALLDGDEQLAARVDLGSVLQLAGAWEPARAQFEVAGAKAALGALLARTGAYPEAIALLEQARAERADLQTLDRLAHAYFEQGDDERALERAREQAALARELGDRAAEGEAIGTLALVLWHQRELEPAREQLEVSLALNQAAGNRVGVVHSLNDLAGVLVALDRHAEALERLAEAYALAGEIGYRRFAGAIVGNAAEVFQTLGDGDAALECAAHSLRIAASLRDVLAVLHNAIVIAVERRRQGAPEEAERVLARVVEVARATDNRRYLAEALEPAEPASERLVELVNPFAGDTPTDPAGLVREAEAALAKLIAADHVI